MPRNDVTLGEILTWLRNLWLIYIITKFRPSRYGAIGLIAGAVIALVTVNAQHVTNHGPSGGPAAYGLGLGVAFGIYRVIVSRNGRW